MIRQLGRPYRSFLLIEEYGVQAIKSKEAKCRCRESDHVLQNQELQLSHTSDSKFRSRVSYCSLLAKQTTNRRDVNNRTFFCFTHRRKNRHFELGISQWNRIFIDSRLTTALVDRFIHHAHIITYSRESYRLTNALSRIN